MRSPINLKGTKTVKKPAPKQHTNGNQYNHSNYIETHNRFESLSEQNSTQHKKQVFHQAGPEEAITLKDIMKEIMSIKARQDLQEQKHSNQSDSQNWRHPTSRKKTTQEQHKEWDSQRRNRSPSQGSQY